MTSAAAEIAAGTMVVAVAASLAGASGFGFSLIAAPLLLIGGSDTGPVVFTCLVLTLVTRLSVALRFRASVDRRSAALLIAGSVPGFYAGLLLARAVDLQILRIVIGSSVVGTVLVLFTPRSRKGRPPGMLRCLAAGLGGGFLGAVAALNGVVPGLVLTQSLPEAKQLFATLALYTFVSAVIGVAIVLATNRIPPMAFVYTMAWAPVAVAGNALGVAAGLRLSAVGIRQLALLVAFVAGAGAVAMAVR